MRIPKRMGAGTAASDTKISPTDTAGEILFHLQYTLIASHRNCAVTDDTIILVLTQMLLKEKHYLLSNACTSSMVGGFSGRGNLVMAIAEQAAAKRTSSSSVI